MKFEARDLDVVWEKLGEESLLIDLKNGIYYSFQKGYSSLLDLLMEGVDGEELGRLNSDASQALVDFLLKEDLVVAAPHRQTVRETPETLSSQEFPEIERYDDLQEIFEMDPIHDGDLERGWPVAN